MDSLEFSQFSTDFSVQPSDIKTLEQDLIMLQSMFKDLDLMVYKQSELIDSLVLSSMETNDTILDSEKSINQANSYLKSYTWILGTAAAGISMTTLVILGIKPAIVVFGCVSGMTIISSFFG
jgi:t-SNARE complex subunit (syntaxin)